MLLSIAIPLIAAGAQIGGQIIGGMQRSASEDKAIREARRQERLRARTFGQALREFGYLDFLEESGELGRRYLGAGEETLAGFEGRLGELEQEAETGLRERITGIQSETQQGLRDVLPGLIGGSTRGGLSPFGGRTQRTIGGAFRTASELANARIQQASFDFFDRLAALNAARGRLGEFRTGVGVGFRGERGSGIEAITGAAIQTPGSIDAMRGTGEFAPGSRLDRLISAGPFGRRSSLFLRRPGGAAALTGGNQEEEREPFTIRGIGLGR